jgi:hypothetical protein
MVVAELRRNASTYIFALLNFVVWGWFLNRSLHIPGWLDFFPSQYDRFETPYLILNIVRFLPLPIMVLSVMCLGLIRLGRAGLVGLLEGAFFVGFFPYFLVLGCLEL